MSTMMQFQGQVEAHPSVGLQAWVTGYIENVAGLGKESLTYVGCSKKIVPPGCLPWFCRKRLGDERTTLPDEHVNHLHAHSGSCCSVDFGIHCFAMKVTVTDHSSAISIEVWAPAMHLFGMKPNSWIGLPKEVQNQLLRHLKDKAFVMLLMAVHEDGVFSHYKVHFVKPISYNPKLNSLGALAMKLESLVVVEDEDEHIICIVGVDFAPPPCTERICDTLKKAVKMILHSYALNARAVSILHELMWEFPSTSKP